MSRLTLFILLLLLLSFPATLADPYYKGWVYPGDTFTADGRLYAVMVGQTPSQIILQQGGESHFISYGKCATSQDRLDRYCLTDSDYAKCDLGTYDCPSDDPGCCPYDVSHIRYDDGKANWAVYLELSSTIPDVVVTRTPEKTSLKLGESADVTLHFENTGTESITIRHREEIPEGFAFTAPSDFTITGRNLTAKFTLKGGTSTTLKYKVTPKEYVDGVFRANMTTTYRDIVATTAPAAFTITVPRPFEVTHAVSPATGSLDEEATYTYTLANTDGQYALDATVAFRGLDALTVVTPDHDVSLKAGAYVWEGTLDKGEEKTFTFKVKGKRTGSYPINASLDLTVNGEGYAYPVQDIYTLDFPELKPDLRLPDKVSGGSPYPVRLFLGNKDGKVTFNTIRGTLVVGNETFPLTYDLIAPDDYPLIFSENLTAPRVETETKLSVTANGTYKTTYGELFTFSTTASTTVSPVIDPFVITQILNDTDITLNDSLSVTVKVKNQADVYKTVTVTDELPGGALVTSGFRQQTLSLEKGQEREAYTYRVSLSGGYDQVVLPVTTTVVDKQTGEIFTKTADVKVTLPPSYATNETNETNTTEPAPQPAPVPEKKGFFRKLVDGIVGFFQGIFS